MSIVESKMITGKVIEIDRGHFNTSLVIQSGKRLFTVIMQNAEVIKSNVEINCNVYCIINNKEISVFRDLDYVIKTFSKKDLQFKCIL